MHPAILGIALGTQLVTPVSDRVPKLNVEATCKATVSDNKAMGLALPQTYEKCMSDTRIWRKSNWDRFGLRIPHQSRLSAQPRPRRAEPIVMSILSFVFR